MEANVKAATIKSAVMQAARELKGSTERYTLREFYPAPSSGLVDNTEYSLEDLEKKDLKGMTGFTENRMTGLWSELFDLNVGESYEIRSAAVKDYKIIVTRVA